MTPSCAMTPDRYISAIASMIPEPQTRSPPSEAVASSEAGIVRPEVRADHLEARLQRLAVDPHPFDRAGRGALAAGNLRALERGAGRRRAGEQALAIAEQDFRVGADVGDQGQLVAQVGRFGERDARRVGADMAGDAGQQIDIGAGRDARARIRRRAPRSRRRGSARTARRRARSDRGRETDDA